VCYYLGDVWTGGLPLSPAVVYIQSAVGVVDALFHYALFDHGCTLCRSKIPVINGATDRAVRWPLAAPSNFHRRRRVLLDSWFEDRSMSTEQRGMLPVARQSTVAACDRAGVETRDLFSSDVCGLLGCIIHTDCRLNSSSAAAAAEMMLLGRCAR